MAKGADQEAGGYLEATFSRYPFGWDVESWIGNTRIPPQGRPRVAASLSRCAGGHLYSGAKWGTENARRNQG